MRYLADVMSYLIVSRPVEHFGAIRLLSPAQKFWALASLPCSVCSEALLPRRHL
jgi:hypothetical protein